MRNKQIPCEDCLVLVMCKPKSFHELLDRCSLIYGLLYVERHAAVYNRKPGFSKMIVDIDTLMGTEHWRSLLTRREYDRLTEEIRKEKGLVE